LTKRRAYILAVGITFIVLAFFIGVGARHQAFNFDEAYNLNVSKTLATKGIYATQLSDRYIPYDPAVTTGPTVIVPIALAIRMFGAQASVIRGTLVVSFIFYLSLAFWAVKEMFGKLVALVFLIVLSTTPLFLLLGVSAQGDVPSICLALFSLALLDRVDRVAKPGPRLLILALSGLSLGLAILAKDILMLLVIAAIAVIAIDLLKPNTHDRRVTRAIPVLFALGIVFGWRGYQYLAMRIWAPEEFSNWGQVVKTRAEILQNQVAYQPLSHLWPAWESAYEDFGPYLLSVALGLLAALLLRYVFGRPMGWVDWGSTGQKTILAASILWCLWYFFLSGPEANNRHFLTGVVFLELLALQFAFQLWSFENEKSKNSPDAPPAVRMHVLETRKHRNARWSTYPIAGLVTCLMIWGIGHGIKYNQQAHTDNKRMLLSQLEVAKWLEKNIPTNSAISGWGWYVPWHISFLANRMPSQVDLHTASLEGMTDWLVLIPGSPSSGVDERLQNFLGGQGHLEYSGGGYEIYRIERRPDDQPSHSSPPTFAEAPADNVKKTSEQLRAILKNVKLWKAQGHNYTELNQSRALTDGLFPGEMVSNGLIRNSFGGPVDISFAPPTATNADTFLLVFSGVPDEDCAKLCFPAVNGFTVYAGTFQKAPASKDQAKSLCTTGNMWFVAR